MDITNEIVYEKDQTETKPVKRKHSDVEHQKIKKEQKTWFELDDKHNTYVYVSNLPLDMKENEFVDLMKKYGVIKMKDVQKGVYNIKMYKDPEGKFKGDAVCCYVRVESVELALVHLDGLNLDGKHIIHAERANFQQRGDYDPSKGPRRKITKKEKLKERKRMEKLLSWKPDKLIGCDEKPKSHLTVVLSNMFDPVALKNDTSLILEIREDVESLCQEECGNVHKVIVYDQHPDGIVTIKFQDFESSERGVTILNNRWYAGRMVKAELWDGKTRYKIEESEEEKAARVAKWQADLEKDDDNETAATSARKLPDESDRNKEENNEFISVKSDEKFNISLDTDHNSEDHDELVDPLEGIEDFDD